MIPFSFNCNEFEQSCDVVFVCPENLRGYVAKSMSLAGVDFYVGYDNYFGLGAWYDDAETDDPVPDLASFIVETDIKLWSLSEALNIVRESAKSAVKEYWLTSLRGLISEAI